MAGDLRRVKVRDEKKTTNPVELLDEPVRIGNCMAHDNWKRPTKDQRFELGHPMNFLRSGRFAFWYWPRMARPMMHVRRRPISVPPISQKNTR